MKQTNPGWKKYERMIARLVSDEITPDLCVTPNARIRGKLSGVLRQIDALIDARHSPDITRRLIVDAKRRNRKIDVTDVEAFLGVMEDVEAAHGYLVCPTGWTKAALARAQELVSIRLVPLNQIENFDNAIWPQCRKDSCSHGRIFWNGYPQLSKPFLADIGTSFGLTAKNFVHYVGKCDCCARFHVFCVACENYLSVPEDDEEDIGHQCACKNPWFWLASVETDSEGRAFAELHVIWGANKIETVDRRAM